MLTSTTTAAILVTLQADAESVRIDIAELEESIQQIGINLENAYPVACCDGCTRYFTSELSKALHLQQIIDFQLHLLSIFNNATRASNRFGTLEPSVSICAILTQCFEYWTKYRPIVPKTIANANSGKQEWRNFQNLSHALLGDGL